MPAPYCLDTSIFIQANNGGYAMDIVPAFWKWLDKEFAVGRITSCRTVYDEIAPGNDDLAQWVKARRNTPVFEPPDAKVQAEYPNIATYVTGKYAAHQSSLFLKGADAWVIARSKVYGMTVVTAEQLVDGTSKKAKIPNVCKQFGVKYTDTYDMLRALGAKFDM